MNFSLIIDIVLGVIALLLIIKFTVKGFLRGVLESFKVVIAGLLAYIIRIPIAKAIDSWFMNKSIVGWVEGSLFKTLEGNDTFVNFIELYNKVPLLFEKILVEFGLKNPNSLGEIETVSEETVKEIAHDLGSSISNFLSTVLAVIVVFILALIALTVVIKILDSLTKFSAIKAVNKLLGFALGVAVAFCVLWAATYGIAWLVNGFGYLAPEVLNEKELNESMIVGFFNTVEISW